LRVKSLQLELDFKEIQINVLNSSLNNSYVFIIQDDKIVFYFRAFFCVEALALLFYFTALSCFLFIYRCPENCAFTTYYLIEDV
jgi:hypothetical protein